MRELNFYEISEVSGAGFFKDLGHAVGEAHNAIETAVGDAVSTAIGLMKNDMYQRSN